MVKERAGKSVRHSRSRQSHGNQADRSPRAPALSTLPTAPLYTTFSSQVAGHKKKRDTKQVVGGKFFANPGRFFRPEFQKLVHARLTKKATNFTRPIIRKEIGAWLRRLFDSPAGLRLIGSPKPFVHGNSKGFLAVGLADCGFELHALPSDDADFLAEWVRAKNDINRWKDDDLVKVETWGLEWFVMALLSGRIGLHKVKNGKVVGTVSSPV